MCVSAVVLLLCQSCSDSSRTIRHGVISGSSEFAKQVIHLDLDSYSDTVFMVIEANDAIIDFGGSTIDARQKGELPDSYKGTCIQIRNSRNVTLRNLNVHGFKFAIHAENVDKLTIENCNFSYNYRPRLGSRWDREALSDWLYYHNNDQDEWLRYGAAVYLNNCQHATVKGVTVEQGFNGLLMTRCDSALVYNNNMSYNSGLGIGMYRSSHNRIMHNKLDWNVRGYSHGKYARGQDSAGILLYEQCSFNTIAFNSATHSGDGLFLWAGQHTMDTGDGGCNYNIIYQNDFSHSVANGVEATFSSNYIIENILNDCRYGVWGGYSHHSTIAGNEIKNCEVGIAIEHGNTNRINRNNIEEAEVAIQLWARESQPDDWGFAKSRDVSSSNYLSAFNMIASCETAYEIWSTDGVIFMEDSLRDVQTLLNEPGPNSNFTELTYPSGASISVLRQFEDSLNQIFGKWPLLPDSLADGMNPTLPDQTLRGRKYIIVNEWGPYNFEYPELLLRRIENEAQGTQYHFSLFGPQANWQLAGGQGYTSVSPSRGTVPTSLVASASIDSTLREIQINYIGEGFIDQFGDTIERGASVSLIHTDFRPQTSWTLQFFEFDSLTEPLENPEAFKELFAGPPVIEKQSDELKYRWWRSPHEGIAADQFALKAGTSMDLKPGIYRVRIESDDGVRLFIDNEVVFENWTVHTPEIDEFIIELSEGTREFTIEYFDAGGLAVIDFEMWPIPARNQE